MEKGYREFGHDIDNSDSPLRVGLGFTVAVDKPGDFIGKEALLRQKEEGVLKYHLAQVLLEDPEPLLYGEEPDYRDGECVGCIRSGAHGHTLGGAVGLGEIKNEAGMTPEFIKSGSDEVEVAGKCYSAAVSLRPMSDP